MRKRSATKERRSRDTDITNTSTNHTDTRNTDMVITEMRKGKRRCFTT